MTHRWRASTWSVPDRKEAPIVQRGGRGFGAFVGQAINLLLPGRQICHAASGLRGRHRHEALGSLESCRFGARASFRGSAENTIDSHDCHPLHACCWQTLCNHHYCDCLSDFIGLFASIVFDLPRHATEYLSVLAGQMLQAAKFMPQIAGKNAAMGRHSVIEVWICSSYNPGVWNPPTRNPREALCFLPPRRCPPVFDRRHAANQQDGWSS